LNKISESYFELGISDLKKRQLATFEPASLFEYRRPVKKVARESNVIRKGFQMGPVSISHVTVICPYELIIQSEIESFGEEAKPEIFSRCKAHLDDTDHLVALLDGPQVDDGPA